MSEPLLSMLSIKETAAKYNIAVHALRVWVKTGELPAVRCGKKHLICESIFRDFLLRGNNQPKLEPVQYGKIRQLHG